MTEDRGATPLRGVGETEAKNGPGAAEGTGAGRTGPSKRGTPERRCQTGGFWLSLDSGVPALGDGGEKEGNHSFVSISWARRR